MSLLQGWWHKPSPLPASFVLPSCLQDLTPPKDSNVRVMVLRDHGSIALSHSACVPLVKGSVHNLKCSEAEHLVRMGVLQVLDPNC